MDRFKKHIKSLRDKMAKGSMKGRKAHVSSYAKKNYKGPTDSGYKKDYAAAKKKSKYAPKGDS